ncbi:hypothetical protein AGMMS49574_29390 [Bacteroidia bacterium]|nr:hypothetical protein AGMMS49574_29390 [Bacteroidia bacterium]GHU64305.1 hypothetical protein FACS1894123_08750 [Bacteroidia bacterium]
MKQINKDITLWVADKIITGVGEEKELARKVINIVKENIHKNK